MEWHELICIRVELTGCKGMLTPAFLQEKKAVYLLKATIEQNKGNSSSGSIHFI